MKKEFVIEGNKKLLSTKEAANYLGISVSTLEQSRINGNLGIPFVKLGSRAVRYRMEDLERYLSSLETFISTSAVPSRNKSCTRYQC